MNSTLALIINVPTLFLLYILTYFTQALSGKRQFYGISLNSDYFNKDEFKNLQSLFNQNFSKYERNMNDISFKNGFTTYRTINDGSIGNNILNTLEVTFHRPNKMSYAEWSMSSPIIGGISLLNDYYFGFENSMTTQSYRISMVSAAMNTQISGNNRAFNFIETLSNRYQ